jgi:hypothetical protein
VDVVKQCWAFVWLALMLLALTVVATCLGLLPATVTPGVIGAIGALNMVVALLLQINRPKGGAGP